MLCSLLVAYMHSPLQMVTTVKGFSFDSGHINQWVAYQCLLDGLALSQQNELLPE